MEVDTALILDSRLHSKMNDFKEWLPAKGGQAQKRGKNSERMTGQRRQRVDHMSQDDGSAATYVKAASSAATEIADEQDSDTDCVNFLGEGPCCLLYKRN